VLGCERLRWNWRRLARGLFEAFACLVHSLYVYEGSVIQEAKLCKCNAMFRSGGTDALVMLVMLVGLFYVFVLENLETI
jgi:hypothetical protein